MTDQETALACLRGMARHRADGYDDWLRVGMALHAAGCSSDDWDRWSQSSPKYKPGDCAKRWQGFGKSDGVGLGTLVFMAKEDGADLSAFRDHDYHAPLATKPEKKEAEPVPVIDQAWVEPGELPTTDLLPEEQLRNYLLALFKPGEVVAYVTDTADRDGKKTPAGKGTYTRTAGEIIAELETGKTIADALKSAPGEGGAWIRINPFDGKGVADANVTDHRFALIESDTLEIERQFAVYRELQIPIAACVHSGGKSLHAVVRIEAGRDLDLYRERVNRLYDVLRKNRFEVDNQNRNPSRLSRMPGVDRAGVSQYLVCGSMGKATWQDWTDHLDALVDQFPPFEDLADVFANPPPLAPELIHGVLRKGHKMIFSGPSKAGKSFALIQLCVAISTGRRWFGHQCERGPCLYVNLELDRPSCVHRFIEVSRAMGVDEPPPVQIWNIRGRACGLKTLLPKLVRRMRGRKYAAVVLDPLYMLLDGEDENSNGEMATFLRSMDEICAEVGASVVFASHFSKGAQGNKAAIDRTAGAGVMARFPDAIVTLSEAETDEEQDGSPFVVEWTLREFARPQTVGCWFRHPLHVMDQDLAGAKVKGASGRPETCSSKDVMGAITTLFNQSEKPTVRAVAGLLGVGEMTVRRRAETMPEVKIYKGIFTKTEKQAEED